MKPAIVILAVLGALAAGGLGAKWMAEFGELGELERQAVAAQMAAQGGSLDSFITASFILLVGFFAALAGGFLSFKDKFALAGGLLLGAGVLPVLFAPQSLIFTALLIASGILAFVAHSKRQRATQ